jgi:hypothetical protein
LFKIVYGKVSGIIYVDFVIYVDNGTPSESKLRKDAKGKYFENLKRQQQKRKMEKGEEKLKKKREGVEGEVCV